MTIILELTMCRKLLSSNGNVLNRYFQVPGKKEHGNFSRDSNDESLVID